MDGVAMVSDMVAPGTASESEEEVMAGTKKKVSAAAAKLEAQREARRNGCALVRTVAANVKRIREAKNLSQAELSAKAKVDISYVGAIERCERFPPLWTLEQLAKGLGVKPAKLLE